MDITITPIKAAFEERDRKHDEARTAYSEAQHEANRELADKIREALTAEGANVSQVAIQAGVTRQTLHSILRRYPAAA